MSEQISILKAKTTKESTILDFKGTFQQTKVPKAKPSEESNNIFDTKEFTKSTQPKKNEKYEKPKEINDIRKNSILRINKINIQFCILLNLFVQTSSRSQKFNFRRLKFKNESLKYDLEGTNRTYINAYFSNKHINNYLFLSIDIYKIGIKTNNNSSRRFFDKFSDRINYYLDQSINIIYMDYQK